MSDRKSIKTIRDNDKAGGSTDARSVKVDLSTTKSVLQEIVGVNSRTEDNGNTREEATITNSTGGRYTGQGPDIRTLKWDEVPDGTIDVTGDIDVTIHSHLSFIRTNPDGSGEIKASSALRPSTKDNRIKANLNVITGPLGDPTWVGTPEGRGSWNMPSQGAVFYDSNWKPIGGITIDALQNILKH